MSRRKNKLYFPENPDAPQPLIAQVSRRVRFEEVDQLGIVWHGRYASYFEDGRTVFGEKYNLAYLDMYREKFVAPIVQFHVDYFSPLRFPDEFLITTKLHWSESAALNFEYEISIPHDNRKISAGSTVQLLTNFNGEILLVRPDYLEDFWQKWKKGLL